MRSLNFFRCLLIAYMMLLASFVHSQQLPSDSLKGLISSMKDTSLANLYLDIGSSSYYESGEADSLLYYCSIALKVSKDVNNKKYQLYAHKFLSAGYSIQKNVSQSNAHLDTALVIAREIGNLYSVGDVYVKQGFNLQLENRVEEAIDSYLNAAEAFEKANSVSGLVDAYKSIATLFNSIDSYKEAKEYVRKAISHVEKIDDAYSKAALYAFIANQYSEYALSDPIYADTTIMYAQKGLEITKANSYHLKSQDLLIALGTAYRALDMPEKSRSYFLESLSLTESGNSAEAFSAYQGMHYGYMMSGDLDSAKSYLDSIAGLEITATYIPFQLQYRDALYQYYKTAGDDSNALAALESYKALNDSLMNDERLARINELEQRYNRVQNERSINELNHQKQIQSLQITRLAFGIIILLVVVVLTILLFWLSNQKKKRRMVEAELRLNRARMDPHFVFNVMSALQAKSMQPNQADEISSYLGKFSKVMRQSLESTFDELTTLEDELDFLNNYIGLERLLRGEAFTYQLDVGDDIETFEVVVPGMILQPFVENAIKHGFKNNDKPGELKIEILAKDQMLCIDILDNGKWEELPASAKLFPSRATQITTDRLLLFNTIHKSKSSFTIGARPEGGTHVQVLLPLLFEK